MGCFPLLFVLANGVLVSDAGLAQHPQQPLQKVGGWHLGCNSSGCYCVKSR